MRLCFGSLVLEGELIAANHIAIPVTAPDGQLLYTRHLVDIVLYEPPPDADPPHVVEKPRE